MTPQTARAGRRRGARAAFTAVALGILLTACTEPPRETGAFDTGPPAATASSVDSDPLLARFGGTYEDAELSAYVDRIGHSILAETHLAGRSVDFTVVDSGLPHAFVRSRRGPIYLTRGLLALMNSEDDLAAVLAHEIAHMTAGHAEERLERAREAAAMAALVGTWTSDPAIADTVHADVLLQLLSYSREQELDADALGVRYAAAAGYDPGATAHLLARLERHRDLQLSLSGDTPPPESLTTHPSSQARIELALATAKSAPQHDPRPGADSLLAMVDGLPWGSEATFYAEGSTLASRPLGIALTLPEGWSVERAGETAVAHHGNSTLMVLDWRPIPPMVTPAAYMRQATRSVPTADIRTLDIAGFSAAAALIRTDARDDWVDLHLVAIRIDPERLGRLVFATRPGGTAGTGQDVEQVLRSIRQVSQAGLRAWEPRHVAIATVEPGDTVRSMAARMEIDEPLEHFLILNGLGPDDPLEPGRRVKLIVR